ncbi:MAG TPA: peroxiredoxin [Chloroflexota bacterium]|jgi:peroxiredoxin|nr:peroxiredoxin [Chloroflexota bacterium]
MAVQKGTRSKASQTPTLRVGDEAPDFELPSHLGGTFKLSALRGQKHVVIAFYPAAFTPVCSAQVPEYEALKLRFESLNAQVVGISVDSTFSNQAWAQALGGITYPLLSDFWPHGEVARRYGVLIEDKGIAERAVFVIDKQGKIAYIDVHEIGEQPDPEPVFAVLRQLG